MRHLIPLLALLLAAPALAVTVAWDANPPEEGVTGYVIHYGLASREYTTETDVGNVTTYDLGALEPGTYLAVTAYNAHGLSSDYSAEVQYAGTPGVPSGPGVPSVTETVVDGLGRSVTVRVTVEVQ